MTLIYDKVTVSGMGLIGASIALSIRRGGLAGQVVGTMSGSCLGACRCQKIIFCKLQKT